MSRGYSQVNYVQGGLKGKNNCVQGDKNAQTKCPGGSIACFYDVQGEVMLLICCPRGGYAVNLLSKGRLCYNLLSKGRLCC